MAQLEDVSFFPREWVLSKLWHSLKSATGIGIVILGGPGAGKTSLCYEIANEKYQKHVLASHFCDLGDTRTLTSVEFIIAVVRQLCANTRIPGFQELSGVNIENEERCRESIRQDPVAAFQKLILIPLLQIKKPKENMFLVVDSIDEVRPRTDSSRSTFKTIGELLSENYTLFPSWVRVLCTARKQSKLPNPLSALRKISLDDQRRVQVVRDVQKFILSRLDQDVCLRQYINRDTAEMLNQLRIKCNGCFLYLEKVLNGIAENFILLREIKEIPGTLYGLYLWMCQRLFTKKQFDKVRTILSVILASQKPLSKNDLFFILQSRNILTIEDFSRRMYILRRLLVKEGASLFHHSFAEWLSDVKYCTQRFLCNPMEGHSMLAVSMASWGPHLHRNGIPELCHHLFHKSRSQKTGSLQLLLLCTGANVTSKFIVNPEVDTHVKSVLDACVLISEIHEAEFDVSQDIHENNIQEAELNLYEGGGEAPCEDICETEMFEFEEMTGFDCSDPVQNTIIKDARIECTVHDACNDGNIDMLRQLISGKTDLELEDRHGRTALNVAARQGHEDLVMELLNEHVNVNHADSNGWTPLRCSAWAGHAGVVNLLLENGAGVDLTDANGRTALRAAAWGGHDEVVASLLRAGACPLKTDIEGRTPLIAAAYMGHADIVEKLLRAGAELNHSDSDGRSALSVAALCVAVSPGHLEVVKMLLENNAYVNHQDKDGSTPLLVAAFEGQREVCELLLEFEADVDLTDKAGRTPLWAAASMGHLAVAELLLFWGAYVDHIDAEGRTVLSVAAAQGNVGVVSLLLARGLDEGHRDNSGWTPLHYAAFEGHDAVCEALIEAGARVDDIDNDGKHALLLASQEGHINVVEKLIKYGCNLDAHSHDGRTSLRAAAVEGFKDIVQVICSRGGNLNYRDSEGRSTLYVLALESRLPMAQILIRHGANVESRDYEGRTPLHISAWQGHLEMVELLVSAGADVNALDRDDRTPLQSASWQGHANIVRLLCERGSEVDHVCNQGATALCIAAQEGFIECVRVLLEFGGDARRSDFFGRTPLRVALKNGHTSISQLLNETNIKRNLSAANTIETQGLDGMQQFNKPSSNSQLGVSLNNKYNQRTAQSDLTTIFPIEGGFTALTNETDSS